MADSGKGAKHLTELTLGISGIKDALDEAKKMIEEQSKEIGEMAAKNIDESMKNASDGGKTRLISDEEVKKAQEQVGKLGQEFEKTARTVEYFKDGSAQAFRTVQTSYDELGRRTDAYYKKSEDGLKEYRRKVTDDNEKREKEYKNTLKSLDSLIRKQKEFTALVERQKGSTVNRGIIKDSKEATEEMSKLNEEIRKTGSVTSEQKAQFEQLSSASKKLAGAYEEAGTKGDSFLKNISDKAKWLGAFYIVDGLKQGLIETMKVIKETEDAVVDLQRVIPQDLSQTDISKELYGIAGKYGRDFADVQEVALKYAQAGNDWNDTLKLTESTMLALNTAELDVNQSTQGLIAITSQWNIEAADTEKVIDKINKTADQFPVTSEKIVSALQRVSGSAKQAGLDIDETIGVITALSEATGRSGENIGTALNSLLIYTSKDKALDTFEEIGNEGVKKAVEGYRTGAKSILDVWKALSANLKELSDEQKQILYEGIGGDEFAQDLETNAADIVSSMKEIYGAAGTYRQNYFVALLDSIGTAEEAIKGVADSEGYSVKENEKYMGTLTAYVERLKSTWKGLAVDLGDGALGLKNVSKFAVELGIVIGELIRTLGGLKPILASIGGAITLLKADKIQSKVVEPIKAGLEGIKTKSISLISTFKEARKEGKSFAESLSEVGIAAGGSTGKFAILEIAVSGLAMAYGAITNVVRQHNQALAEEREKTLELTDSKLAQSQGMSEAANKFIELAEKESRSSQETKTLHALADELGISLEGMGQSASGAASDIDVMSDAIAKASDIANGLSPAEWESRLEAIKGKFVSSTEKEGWFGAPINDLKVSVDQLMTESSEAEKKAISIVKDTLSDYQKDVTNAQGDVFTSFVPTGEEAEDKLKFIGALKSALEDLNEESRNFEGIGSTEIYSEISDVLGNATESVEEYIESMAEFAYAHNDAKDAIDETGEGFDEYIDKILESTGIGEEFREEVENVISELLEADGIIIESADSAAEFANSISITQTTIDDFANSSNELSDALDDMQTGLDAVADAYSEFNEQGFIGLDTVQKLLSAGGEYISLLQFTENGITLNEEATGKLIDAQRTNALEMVKQAAVADVLEIAQKHLEEQNRNAEASTDALTSSLTGVEAELANATVKYLEGAAAANEYAQQAALAAKAAAPEGFDTSAMVSEIQDVANGYKGLYDYIQHSFNGIEHYSANAAKAATKSAKKAGSAAKKAAADATRALKKELNEQKKAVKERYDAEIKEIDKAKKALKSKYDADKKALSKQKDAISDRYDAEKDALEAQKDAVKDRYDAQIDALKDVQKENDRLDKQEEYLKNKRAAEKDLAKAQVRSGVEWREKEADAKEKLDDIESDRQKELRDEAVEDQIAALEKARDAEIKAIEQRIDGIEHAKEAELDAIDAQMDKLEEKYDREKEALDKKKEQLQEQRDAEIKAIEDKIAAADKANSTMASDYQSGYLNPTLDSTKQGFKATFDQVATDHKALVDQMNKNADDASEHWRKVSEQMRRQANEAELNWKRVSEEFRKPPQMPNPALIPEYAAAHQAYNNTTNVNNNKTNNQMYANFYGISSANGIGNSFFTKP